MLATILVLIAIYSAIIAAIAWLLRRSGIATGRAIAVAIFIFGLVSGVLVAKIWPYDTSVLVNFPAAWLGDWIYVQTIAWIGDPYSDRAHETIPWIFRVPQVYALASCVAYALIGSAAEILYRRTHSNVSGAANR